MVRLTNATKLNRKGETVDASLYLIHFDSRNLAIIEGEVTTDARGAKKQNVIAYYGSVKSAFTRSIDTVIKHGCDPLELSEVLHAIDLLEKRIETLHGDLPSMMELLQGGES